MSDAGQIVTVRLPLANTLVHLLRHVLPAAAEYEAGERELSHAWLADQTPGHWEAEGWKAYRKAAELAVAIDGLTDRAARDLGLGKDAVRAEVGTQCFWPGTNEPRFGCLERIRGVANVYKHKALSDPTLPLTSEHDVLAVAVPYGIDSFGVGKYDGVEVLVHDKAGKRWKFLGDVPVAIGAWIRFLSARGISCQSRLLRSAESRCTHETPCQ